jgi:hypothetical protein
MGYGRTLRLVSDDRRERLADDRASDGRSSDQRAAVVGRGA